MRRALIILLALILLGCSGSYKGNNTSKPIEVKPVPFLRQAVVMSVDGDYKLIVFFELPTPCHKIEFRGMSISGHTVIVDFDYIPPKPGTVCVQIVKKENKTIDLGRLSSGNYTIMIRINGSVAKILKFRVP